jgi:sugar-specific transcriptional regulator TrmB
LSHERVIKTLESLGLSRAEAKIYVYLASRGPCESKEIVNSVGIKIQLVNASLRNLECRGLVKIIAERLNRFAAVPFETVLEMLTKAKAAEAQNIKENKEGILSRWYRNLTEN